MSRLFWACSGGPQRTTTPRRKAPAWAAIVGLIVMALPACQEQRPIAFRPLAQGPLFVRTHDGVRIAATVTGHGRRVVILSAMSTADQSSWAPFVAAAKDQATLVTYDRRGVGASGGTADYLPFSDGNAKRDITAVYDLLRAHGYTSVGCIGASLGGTSCYLIARYQGVTALGIVASNPPSGASTDYLHGLHYPKLFVVGSGDRDLVWPVEHMEAGAPGPKRLVELDTDRHATNIFQTDQGPALLAALLRLVQSMPAE